MKYLMFRNEPTTRAAISLLILCQLLLMVFPAYAQTTVVEVFEIHYSDAQELKESVGSVLSDKGKVTVNNPSNTLIVVDAPAYISRAKDLIELLDRRPKNIRIDVEFIEKEKLERLGVNVDWQVSGPGWTVGNVPPGKDGVHITGEATTSTLDSKKKQFLLLMEGSEGRIFVGESVPFTEYYYSYGYRHGYVNKNVTFKDAGTSFIVTARTAGKGKMRVSLEPEVSYYDKERETFSVKNASTVLVMDDPGSVVIANSEGGADSFSVNFLRGIDKEKSQSSFVMILSVKSEE